MMKIISIPIIFFTEIGLAYIIDLGCSYVMIKAIKDILMKLCHFFTNEKKQCI